MKNNLRTVIRHEYLTIVRQPSFWIIMVAIPVVVAAVIGLSYFGGKSSSERLEKVASELKDVSVIDQSGLINRDIVTSGGLEFADSSQLGALKDQVRQDKKEALIVYPKNLATSQQYQVYVSSTDFTISGSVADLAGSLLQSSLYAPLGSAEVIALAQGGGHAELTTYENGQVSPGFNAYVVPGLFVVLFYIIFAFSISYMLTSVAEEKENRSMEMVLTYVRPRSLIVGKLIAVTLVTLTQVAFFTVLALIGYFAVRSLDSSLLSLPAGIDLSKLVFDPVSIFFSASFLIVGFLMFAGFMTATAAATPGPKEANSFSAVFFIGAFAPFYLVMMILTDPENPITQFVTFFPLTSPVVTLLRNTVGNMSLLESSLALAVMTVFMVLTIMLAVRLFRLGALEFSSRLSLKSLFK